MLSWAVALRCDVASGAQVSRWTDDHGQVHFSDRPPQAGNAQNVEVKSYTGTANISVVPGGYPTTTAQVQMLSATWCGVCKKAKAYLKKLGVPFVEHDVERDDMGKREYKRLKGRGVPIILVGDRRMNGFSATKLEQMLRQAGLLKQP
ncbi:MAG: glutaredoxin domain-containing protein [Acidiferrobacterales bacterium]